MNLACPPSVRHFDCCAACAVGTPAGREHWWRVRLKTDRRPVWVSVVWLEDQRVTR